MKEVRSDAWHARPILGGLPSWEAEWEDRERPAKGYAPVTTRISAAVVPDLDYRQNGVLWGVTFHRYTPKRPLEMRHVRNETTGQIMDVPPPPIIPEHRVGGRVRLEGRPLEEAMKEARELCEQAVRAGRPRR